MSLIFKEKRNFFEFLIFLILKFLSIFYLFLLTIKNFIDALKRKKIFKNKKIVSIGNITWGGTGKTSFTILVIKILKELNKNFVVIQRGYPKNFRNTVEVLNSNSEKYTDESSLIKKIFPDVKIFLSKNRIKAIEESLKKENFEYIVLDDGFQYRKIKKDFEILLIDATQAFEKNCLIPAGSLREPLRNIKRADLIVISHCEIEKEEKIKKLENKIRKYNKNSPIFHLFYKIKNLEELKSLKGEFGAFCGIGNPESFFKLLKKEGFILKEEIVFPDHYDYKKLNLNKNLVWFTTEKDFVKLKNFKEYKIKEVKIEAWLKEEEKLKQLFLTGMEH